MKITRQEYVEVICAYVEEELKRKAQIRQNIASAIRTLHLHDEEKNKYPINYFYDKRLNKVFYRIIGG